VAGAFENLSEQQRRFVLAYAEAHNGSEAARLAGYSPDTAR